MCMASLMNATARAQRRAGPAHAAHSYSRAATLPIAVYLEHFLHMAHNTNPADFGWSYQGSNAQSRVEFWQHSTTGAKLDYYPTSASIKYSGREGC